MIKIVSNHDLSFKQKTVLRTAAIVSSFVATALILLCLSYNPLEVFSKIVEGSLGTAYRFRETCNKTILLTMLSLGIGIAFKMKFWNIGAEGQFYMGAYGASLIAFAFPELPKGILLTLMILSGFVFGGLFALIPAALKIKFSTSETLVTLMLNYIAQKWISYLQYGPWKSANGFPKIDNFAASAVLPKVFGIHIGWILTLLCAVLLFVVFRKTKFGYEIMILGESEATARYAGINVARVLVVSIFISGGLCGLAGMMQASAIERSLSDQLSGGMGFTAVITTWLSALNPLLMIVVSFVFSMLIQGGSFLQSSLQIPASMSHIILGIIIFFVLGSEFFVRYKFAVTFNREKKSGGKS